jgi:membrane protease YdiL (CAAX protease family)
MWVTLCGIGKALKLVDTTNIILVYYAIAETILLAGGFFPTRTESATYIPILLSLLLLIPIYVWQKNYRRKTELSKDILEKDKRKTVFWILALLALALSIRVPSVLIFGEPYEKTPLIYLLLLTILVIEKTDLSAFGFKTENLGKALLYGLTFFVVLSGLALTIQYFLVYGFTGQIPVQSFDIQSSLLTMPFMTLCVGISEEGLFRGYMQTHLEKIYSSKEAILIQAILFGGWHFVWNLYPFDPIGMAQRVVTTFLFGLVFGYFYSKTRNLVPVVLAHGLWDSVPQWVIENQQVMSRFSAFSESIQTVVWILPFILSTMVAVLFVKYFARKV